MYQRLVRRLGTAQAEMKESGHVRVVMKGCAWRGATSATCKCIAALCYLIYSTPGSSSSSTLQQWAPAIQIARVMWTALAS